MKHEYPETIITRRDFLKGAACGTLGMALGLSGLEAAPKETLFNAAKPLSRVVLVRDDLAVDDEHRIDAAAVARMIDTAVMRLSGEKDGLKAWRRYLRPGDTVGIKFTHCGWMRVHTEDAVLNAIRSRLRDIGVAKVHAQDTGLPLKECTALINVPSIKAHTLTGIAVALKNYINFTARPDAYHHEGSGKLGEAWLLPEVKEKTRLIIVDALRPYFGPGPQINPLHRWDYKGILASTDPVAVDAVCLRLCQAKRNLFKGEEWPIAPPPISIASADTDYHLGTSNPRKIKLIRAGWGKDTLI